LRGREYLAEITIRLDRFADRLERIEKRTGLIEVERAT
jgi:hypothetical protein